MAARSQQSPAWKEHKRTLRLSNMWFPQQCKHPGGRILTRETNTPSQCSTHHQDVGLTQSPLTDVCPRCSPINELWLRAQLLLKAANIRKHLHDCEMFHSCERHVSSPQFFFFNSISDWEWNLNIFTFGLFQTTSLVLKEYGPSSSYPSDLPPGGKRSSSNKRPLRRHSLRRVS